MKLKIINSLLLLLSALGLQAACVEIICPADIVTGCTSSNGAPVNFAPQASTTCGTTIEVECLPPSGTMLPIGTNLVTCAVSDPRGNMERCQFLVIVTNSPPVIECPENIYAQCLSPNGAIVGFNPVARAGCDSPVSVACIPPSGSVFPIGTNSVACAATDEFGRMDRCTFFVIITNAPPKITCPPPITLTVGTNCRAVLPLIPVSVVERCTPSNQLVFAQSPPAGTLLALGDHTVTVWVSEEHHLDASCTVEVHVIDTIPPKLACPGGVNAYCAPDGTNVSFNVTATDNCNGPVTVTCEPPSGSFFPNGSTIVTCIGTDDAGNSDQCTFGVNVMSGPPTLTYIAGSKDNYALPADPTSKSACLVTAMTGIPTISEFDQNFAGRWLGHSFENLPSGIQSATLRMHMKPKGNTSSNDVLRIGLTNCAVGAQWAWSAPIKSLPGMGGVWTTNGSTHITFNLNAMPGGPSALLPLLAIDQTHRLDIAIGEDTVVDWFELKITTCEASGAVGGVPYMLKQGESIPGPDDSIEFTSDGETPFDVDLNLGKAEGVVIELGDDWPGATNPPISECTTPASSLHGMKIEWKPAGDLLCTVRAMYDIVPDYVDVLLTQPTNISGGRAIEVWRDGQMVSRYFHEEGYGPIDASGVVLPHDACVQSMGFGIGDFFMALEEEVPIWPAFAKHVSGEESPVMGDFVRLIFNVPMTVSDGGRVRFDPDVVLNIQGDRLDVRGVKVRKFGGWWEGFGSDVMTVSDGLVVNPGLGNDIFGACFEPAPLNGSKSYSESVMINMADLLNCQGCGPGTVFTIYASAQRIYSPPERKTIGTLTCEILTTNPLKTRFTADFSSVGSSTEALVFHYGDGSLGFDTFPSNQVVEVEGALAAIELAIVNDHAQFSLRFDYPPGGTAMVDDTPYSTLWQIALTARAQMSPHEAPYKFCINAVQRIPLELFRVSPPMPSPPPSGNCVTITCPTNVLARCQSPEGAVAHFEVTASTTCGSNITVVCMPPSGSLFAPGVTYVGCQASDNLGYAASCRFPVTVAGQCAPTRHWVSLLNGAAEGSPVVVEVLQATPTDTEVEITVLGFWTETDVYGGREFSRIELPEVEVRGIGFPTKPGERGWFDFPERQNQVRRSPSRFTQAAAINFSRPAFPESALGEMPTTAAEMARLGIDPRGAQPGLYAVGFSLAASPLNTAADLRVSTVASDRVPQAFDQPVMPAGFQGQDAAPASQGYEPPELLDETYYSGQGTLGDLSPALTSPQLAGRLARLGLNQPLFRLMSQRTGEFIKRTRLHIAHAKGTEDFARRLSWDAWMSMPRFVNGAGLVESLNVKGIDPLALRAAHYLILTPQAWRPALEEFAQWKRKKGLHVDFAIVRPMVGGDGDVDPDRDAIDTYIENYFAEYFEDGVYVLLVGDVDVIPSGRKGNTNMSPDFWEADSDHVYEALGFYVDASLSVGRLSCNTEAELQTQLNKILAYERSPSRGDWPTHATLCANKEKYPLKYTANVLSIWDYDYFVQKPAFTLLLAGSPDPDFMGTTPKLVDEINAGRGWVLYRGHGGSESWGNGWDAGTNVFDPSDIMLLNNGVTPIIASIACQTGRIKYDDCLGERFMAYPQGAVAFYGATVNTHTYENHRRSLAFFRAVFEFDEQRLGPALNLVDELSNSAGSDLDEWIDNTFSYLLLGDPEMAVRRKPLSTDRYINVGATEIVGGTVLVVSNNDGETEPGLFINVVLPNGGQTNGFTGPDGTLFLEGISPDKLVGLDIMGDGVPPVFVVVNPPTLTPLGFESGGFGVTLHGVAGGHYEIEGSSDLKNWSSIGAGVAGPDGLLHIVDPQAATLGQRFYRGRVMP